MSIPPLDPFDPRIHEAMAKIKKEASSPAEFNFDVATQAISEGSVKLIADLQKHSPSDVSTGARAEEFAHAFIQLVKDQHAIHPLTPTELAIGIQIGVTTLSVANSQATFLKVLFESVQSISRTLNMAFQLSILANIMKKHPPKKS